MEYALLPFRRYFEFRGRSRRKEYWMFTLVLALASFAIGLVERATGLSSGFGNNGIVSNIFSAVTFIPSLSVLVRRLHDTNRSGWWLLAFLPPLILFFFALAGSLGDVSTGAGLGGLGIVGVAAAVALLGVVIALFVFTVLDGTRGPNRYGPDPKDPTRDLGEVFN